MDLGTKLFRTTLLTLAGNKAVESFALKYGLKWGANKFVAGKTLEEALEQVKILNNKGIKVTLDHLGEGIRQLEEAASFKDEYLRIIKAIHAAKLDSNVSLKPTQMGLQLNPAACYENIREIVREANRLGNFVRLDMEDSPYTEATIHIVRRLHAEGLTNVGTVIQAYLHRSEQDILKLTAEHISLRLVKGAYKEPKQIAYQEMSQVNDNFRRIIQMRLDSGVYTAIATHDDRVIEWTKNYAAQHNIKKAAFEFQMLYGVRMPLQEELAREGCRVRCYVPYGRMWYPYFIRRLAERPANVLFVIRNMMKK
ncbi:proline dehydrogenase family protein [Paenibacillus sediminis]|uniref:proline dehydrogenase n=1 Tax=Paenibacillus sediminis TaxID=664909 RepID=A0ABS4H3Y5_9BACL|nr:proline dehydrogenase family protein [Paenibacillus sediminis]MBP1936982.1 proline dehydrogenase [Paenibacillus sediminis]